MASNNNALMLALVAGGGYLAYKSGFFKFSASAATTSGGSGTASSNSASAPTAADATPAPGRNPNDPRGIRNNNPGNIVYNASNNWQGQVGTDGTFVKFALPDWGIRAAFVLLRNYCKIYGACTIRAIANRWAPAPANNPTSYAMSVSGLTGIPVDDPINVNDPATMVAVLRGITAVENGSQYYNFYTDAVMSNAFQSAMASGNVGL